MNDRVLLGIVFFLVPVLILAFDPWAATYDRVVDPPRPSSIIGRRGGGGGSGGSGGGGGGGNDDTTNHAVGGGWLIAKVVTEHESDDARVTVLFEAVVDLWRSILSDHPCNTTSPANPPTFTQFTVSR